MVKRIPLTQGKYALVDDDVYEWSMQWQWYAMRAKNTFYACRSEPGTGKSIYLHREIMNAPSGIQVDHEDGSGLNCTRANMRLATNTQNLRNRGAQANNTSGYKGVTWHKAAGKWAAQIKGDGKNIHLGLYADIIEAAKTYDKAAKKYHGRFAKTNF